MSIDKMIKEIIKEVKTCPCCEGKGQLFCIDGVSKWVLCTKCGLKTFEFGTVSEAVAAWNLRPDTKKPEEEKFHQNKCNSCGKPMSNDCPTCQRLWES